MVSVDLSGQLRWLAVSCEGLSLFVATYKDGATDISFYDVRSLVNGGRAPFARQTPPPSPGNKNVISAAWNPGSFFLMLGLCPDSGLSILPWTEIWGLMKKP